MSYERGGEYKETNKKFKYDENLSNKFESPFSFHGYYLIEI